MRGSDNLREGRRHGKWLAADVHACALRIREGRPASFTLRLATFTPGAWRPGLPGVSPGAWGRAFQGLGKANSVSAICTEREREGFFTLSTIQLPPQGRIMMGIGMVKVIVIVLVLVLI